MDVTTPAYENEQFLVTGMLSGSRDGFGRLYDRYAPSLFGYILKVTGDKAVAEEILLKAFKAIWKNRKNYNSATGRLYIWIFKLTRETMLPFIAPKQNIINKEIQNAQIFVSSNITNNELLYNMAEFNHAVLELMYFNKCSLKETSAALNIDEERVKLILRCAVKNLSNE